MGLIDRMFRNGKNREAAGASASTQFQESEPDSADSQPSRNAPRRELVQVVLRDTMRKHGIPSDWIECRVLSAVTRSGRAGLHVNFVVRQAHDRLITYVFAFQDSFERELGRYEPRARDWLLSLGWEFDGFKPAEMPNPNDWIQSAPAPLGAASLPPLEIDRPKADEDVERDLKALYAIRDAAMADTSRRVSARAEHHQDFQETQPSDDGDPRRA